MPHTVENTRIDIWDTLGLQPPALRPPSRTVTRTERPKSDAGVAEDAAEEPMS
jgi:hypothetical protein